MPVKVNATVIPQQTLHSRYCSMWARVNLKFTSFRSATVIPNALLQPPRNKRTKLSLRRRKFPQEPWSRLTLTCGPSELIFFFSSNVAMSAIPNARFQTWRNKRIKLISLRGENFYENRDHAWLNPEVQMKGHSVQYRSKTTGHSVQQLKRQKAFAFNDEIERLFLGDRINPDHTQMHFQYAKH